MSVDVEELELRVRVHELLDELGIVSRVLCDAMTDDPARAIAVLEHALRVPRLRNRASFAIARWRDGAYPQASERERLHVERAHVRAELPAGAPTLEALELAWSLEDEGSLIATPALAAMTVAIERAGGCRAALYRPELFGD